jgi:RNA polymerase-binding protein DksA
MVPLRIHFRGLAGRASMEGVDPRRLLEVERKETLARLAGLTGDYDAVVAASRDSTADDEHDPEGATIAFERSQIGAFVEQVRQHLAEIDAAVERIESGRYGTCERCGAVISEARLEARPVARTCIDCAAAT